MDQGGGDLLWLALLGFMVVVLFLPQWLARRRQKKQKESLQIGDQVLTIGGFIGELTHLDLEQNIARLKLAHKAWKCKLCREPLAVSAPRRRLPRVPPRTRWMQQSLAMERKVLRVTDGKFLT